MARLLKCPICKQGMEYLGNVSGRVYATNPPSWDGVYICRKDRTKTIVREGDNGTVGLPPLDLDEYRRVALE